MSNYINQVSDSLKNHISELANNPCLFLRNPNVDFSRKRKSDFKTFIGIMMNSGGATMSKELLDFFDFNKNTPSVSAFTQQRSKVLPEAFEYLFKSFTDDNLQIPLHRITDSASNGSVFPVVTEHFSASSDHAFL